MARTAMIRARITPDLKEEVEFILKRLGLTTTEAINIFFSQVKLQRGLPFEVKIPTSKLVAAKQLEPSYKDHSLIGSFKDRRECHIEPDWLLVYKVNRKEKIIIFERTGSHPDIFE